MCKKGKRPKIYGLRDLVRITTKIISDYNAKPEICGIGLYLDTTFAVGVERYGTPRYIQQAFADRETYKVRGRGNLPGSVYLLGRDVTQVPGI